MKGMERREAGWEVINKNKGVISFRGIFVSYALHESPKINSDLIRSRFADANLFFGPGFALICREIRQRSMTMAWPHSESRVSCSLHGRISSFSLSPKFKIG